MSRCCSLGLCASNPLYSLSSRPRARSVRAPLYITSHTKPNSNTDSFLHNVAKIKANADDYFGAKKTISAAQLGAVLATIDHPALAITGVNHEQELSSVVLDIGIISVWYFLVMPPIIMNWLRVRWYRRLFSMEKKSKLSALVNLTFFPMHFLGRSTG